MLRAFFNSILSGPLREKDASFSRVVLSLLHRPQWNFDFRICSILSEGSSRVSLCISRGGSGGGGQDVCMRVVLCTHVYLKGVGQFSCARNVYLKGKTLLLMCTKEHKVCALFGRLEPQSKGCRRWGDPWPCGANAMKSGGCSKSLHEVS